MNRIALEFSPRALLRAFIVWKARKTWERVTANLARSEAESHSVFVADDFGPKDFL